MIFAKGYAGQRNIVLFDAIKHKIDYLIFFDDDATAAIYLLFLIWNLTTQCQKKISMFLLRL